MQKAARLLHYYRPMFMESWNIKIKDVIQWGLTLIAAVTFFTTMNTKIDACIVSIAELKQSKEKDADKTGLFYQQFQNQLNLNTQQIELIKQDIQYMKAARSYKP